MLKYKLISENNDEVIYAYYPEGGEAYGSVLYRKTTGEFEQISLASGDEGRWYYRHMVRRLRDFARKGEFQTEGMVAWY